MQIPCNLISLNFLCPSKLRCCSAFAMCFSSRNPSRRSLFYGNMNSRYTILLQCWGYSIIHNNTKFRTQTHPLQFQRHNQAISIYSHLFIYTFIICIWPILRYDETSAAIAHRMGAYASNLLTAHTKPPKLYTGPMCRCYYTKHNVCLNWNF